jgi:hypothetical protein
MEPRCFYCGETKNLRIECDGGEFAFGHRVAPVEYICEDCFVGTDTGPSFDDLAMTQQHA